MQLGEAFLLVQISKTSIKLNYKQTQQQKYYGIIYFINDEKYYIYKALNQEVSHEYAPK